ncbi:MAG: DUF5301 domain-containing protein [Tissierellia bacterium]|nr:DUF5301 domain-containing protein [Tissierellia bacterium]
MKRILSITVIAIMIIMLASCGKENRIFPTPKAEDVAKISTSKIAISYVYEIMDKDKIVEILDVLEKVSDTGKESVNDIPTNVKEPDDIHIVNISYKDDRNDLMFFVYEDNGEQRVEIPYSGIWKVDSETDILKLLVE